MFTEIKYCNDLLMSARSKYKNFKGKRLYLSLLEDTKLLNYFKRYYPFIEIPGMRKFLSRSKLYDSRFISKIESEVKNSKKLFLENLQQAAVKYGTDFKVKVSNRDLHVMYKLFMLKVYPFRNYHETFSVLEQFNQLNLRASSGLPEPWFSKRTFSKQILRVLEEIEYQKFDLLACLENGKIFTAAFIRFQITSSAMKARLVFCLYYVINVCEVGFDMELKTMFNHPLCPFIHGKTQIQISKLVSAHSGYYNISMDTKEFDLKTPGEILVLAFEYMFLYLDLVRGTYRYNLLCQIRDLLLCMPCYHPTLAYTERKRGIISGSGLTSSLGSFCNYIMHTLTLITYCKMHKINIFRVKYFIYVSSDDSLIYTSFRIDPKKYTSIFLRKFDMVLEVESVSKPGTDSSTFLGSTWENGKPYRNTNRLFARIIFGNPNMPDFKGNDHLIFASRCYEILGNVANFEKIWNTFGVPMPERLFRFSELFDYNRAVRLKEELSLDRRGFWETRDSSVELDSVWTHR